MLAALSWYSSKNIFPLGNNENLTNIPAPAFIIKGNKASQTEL
jgi:hypothetical protein